MKNQKKQTKIRKCFFRATEEAYQKIEKDREQLASMLNKKIDFSEYCRICLLKENVQDNILLEEKLRDMIYQIRKIGVNINQIAKCINQGLYVVGEEGLKREIPRLKEQLSNVENQITVLFYGRSHNGDHKINEHKSQ